MIQRRFLCSQAAAESLNNQKWRIKQVTKSNFNEVLDEVKSHIAGADFIAVSLRNTGAFSAPWQKVAPFDTAGTAYAKAKSAAERFEIFQFALCPFTLRDSKLTAYPYNFNLFPRDELKLGIPSYSFSCQTSYFTSMARVGFDFNLCIYDGISYVSKAQESKAISQLGKAFLSADTTESSPASSVGDTVFLKRIRSRVSSWRSACKSEDPLVRSLRNIAVGSEEHGSRPCLNIDVCSERQVQLALEAAKDFSEDVFPLLIPSKSGEIQAVRLVLTSSTNDKTLFKEELEEAEEREKKRIRGFREVIDLISASEKPVVAHNALNDFTYIHAKFFGPLPPSIKEFKESLGSNFRNILDLSHLFKELNPQNTLKNIPAALSYIRNRFPAPLDIETPLEGLSTDANEGKVYGHGVIRVSQLFGKLSSLLKRRNSDLTNFANVFSLCSGSGSGFGSDDSLEESFSGDNVSVSTGKQTPQRKLGCEDLVFLWGFGRGGMSARALKRRLVGTHQVLSDEKLFDVRLVDEGCAIVAFWRPGASRLFVEAMCSEEINASEPLKEMASEGIRVAGYGAYRVACRMGISESDLADALDKAEAMVSNNGEVNDIEGGDARSAFEIDWKGETLINLDDL